MSSAAKILERRRAAALLRPAVDLSENITTPVLQQGPRPTCVPCALAGAHESERAEDAFQPAVESIWWDLHSEGKAGPQGALLADAVASLAKVGQCRSAYWPYDTTLGFGTQDPPTAAGKPPWTQADARIFKPAHDGVESEIEDRLVAGHPVVAIVEVTDEFRYPETDGFVSVPPIRVNTGGYHAVLIAGAWTDPDHGRVFLVRNSWGDRWGAGGYCLLDVRYLIAYCVQLAELEIVKCPSN